MDVQGHLTTDEGLGRSADNQPSAQEKNKAPVLTSYDLLRFWEKVDRRGPDQCWPWTGAQHVANGTGVFWIVAGKTQIAHRIAFLIATGKWPAGQMVLHSCDNPPCVNPSHLRAGTSYHNYLDSKEHGAIGRRARVRAAALELYTALISAPALPLGFMEDMTDEQKLSWLCDYGDWWLDIRTAVIAKATDR